MSVNQQMQQFNAAANRFFAFVNYKLSHFSQLTRLEQVAYIAIAVGLLLTLTSMVLFIL